MSIGRLISLLLSLLGVTQALDIRTVNEEAMIGKMPLTFNNAPKNTSGLSGLFLNTEYCSPCNGSVTAWDFCYYINVTHMSKLTIQAGVWRKSGEDYTLVNNSLIDLPIPDPRDQPGFQFICRHWVLSEECRGEPPFEVQKGDIVGMYVNDTSDENVVHVLGTPPNNASNAGTMRSREITDINEVSNSSLMPVSYSLYLVAVLGNGSATMTCPTTTTSATTTTTDTNSALYLPEWAILLIICLGGIILVLVIIIVAIICKLCQLYRIKGSGPVLITRLNHRNKIAQKGPAISNTELNSNSENVSYESSQHDIRPQKPLHSPPLLTVLDQGGLASSLSGTHSPQPVAFAIAFDDDQQTSDCQDETTLNQPANLHNKDSQTKAQKVALLPKLDLRRSRSAAEAMNLSHTNTAQTTDDLFTSSSEYPYVVHTFEVMEKERGIHVVGSLPNMLQLAQSYSTSNFMNDIRQENTCDKNTTTDVIPHASVTVESSDDDDEPPYSYTDMRELFMQNPTINGNNMNLNYEEYPSDWMHAAKDPTADSNIIYDSCQSPDYQDIDEFNDSPQTMSQSTSVVQSSNHASPVKQSDAKENSIRPQKSKTKPPIQPRKHLVQKIAPSNPASPAKHPSNTDEITHDDSDNLNVQTPDKYMKLLPSTMNDFQVYTRLENGITGTDLEQTDPNQ